MPISSAGDVYPGETGRRNILQRQGMLDIFNVLRDTIRDTRFDIVHSSHIQSWFCQPLRIYLLFIQAAPRRPRAIAHFQWWYLFTASNVASRNQTPEGNLSSVLAACWDLDRFAAPFIEFGCCECLAERTRLTKTVIWTPVPGHGSSAELVLRSGSSLRSEPTRRSSCCLLSSDPANPCAGG